MKTLSQVTTRRDRCYLFGRRAARLNPKQMVKAWRCLSATLEIMGDVDMPKFENLLWAVRYATVTARMKGILEQLEEMPPLDPNLKTPIDLEEFFKLNYAIAKERKK